MIIYGLKECNAEITNFESKSIDNYEVGRLFEFMDLRYQINNVKEIQRLGEKTTDKIRVLRVVLNSEFDREILFRSRFSLMGSENYNQVYLQRDRMFSERLENKIRVERNRQSSVTSETPRSDAGVTETPERAPERNENSPVESEEATSDPQDSVQQPGP